MISSSNFARCLIQQKETMKVEMMVAMKGGDDGDNEGGDEASNEGGDDGDNEGGDEAYNVGISERGYVASSESELQVSKDEKKVLYLIEQSLPSPSRRTIYMCV